MVLSVGRGRAVLLVLLVVLLLTTSYVAFLYQQRESELQLSRNEAQALQSETAQLQSELASEINLASSLQAKVDNSVPTYAYCGRNSAECGMQLAKIIQQDPRFIEQEHGLNFTFFTSGIGCQGCDPNDPNIQLPYQLMFEDTFTNSTGTFRALLWAIVPESGIYFDLTAVTFQYSPPSIPMRGG